MQLIKVIKIREDYYLEGLLDYGFKYNNKSKCYEKSGLVVDEKSREVYSNDKCTSETLSTILEMEKYSIACIEEIYAEKGDTQTKNDEVNILSQNSKTPPKKAKTSVKIENTDKLFE